MPHSATYAVILHHFGAIIIDRGLVRIDCAVRSPRHGGTVRVSRWLLLGSTTTTGSAYCVLRTSASVEMRRFSISLYSVRRRTV